MKKPIAKIVLAVATFAACAMAGAQTTDQADAQRRAANREEAIARHNATTQSSTSNFKENTKDAARSTGRAVKSTTHKAAQSTRNFTHRQLTKARNFGERTNRKFPAKSGPDTMNKGATALGK